MVSLMTAMTATNRNKVVLVSAFTAAALGVAGLAALAIPAGAGEQPTLPDISAEELVSSVLSAQPPAMDGSIHVANALGLPPLPGLPRQLINGSSEARIWFDGDGRSRLALPSQHGEQILVHDGTTVWRWDSTARTATKLTPSEHAERSGHAGEAFDPATAARQLLDLVRPTSTIAIDGTAMVADRPAYELVLSPAPTERSLLREVRIAVDSEFRMPLRVEALGNGSNDPVFSVGFDQLSVGPQDASLFRFEPPTGAKVTEPDADAGHRPDFAGGIEPTVVGDGWDTVVVLKLPTGTIPEGSRGFLDQLGTPVSGAWGSGRLISTAVVSAILTEDGRVAAGAVPQQVLIEALSR
jgi:outer membrane lipoprotein-sorting protein